MEQESTKEVLTTENKRLESDLSKATAAAAAKSEQILKDRTGRWISWRERAQSTTGTTKGKENSEQKGHGIREET